MSEVGPKHRRALRIALLGCGTVGSHVVRLLHSQADELAARIGARLDLVGVAVRDANRPRPDLPLDPALFTADAATLATRPDVDIVIELVGGVDAPRSWLTCALKQGKSVVTANKALLAADGAALHDAAAAGSADLYYEAAVAGAIPLLRPLRESLHGDRISHVMGIVNGTTNYILSNMDETGAGFEECLAQATELGYAEADPTADVDGLDAAAKAAIIASLAFHTRVSVSDVYCEGIRGITAADVAAAQELDRTIKLLCIAERVTGADTGRDRPAPENISVRVHPAMIPRSHPLAAVGGAYNAVFIQAQAAGSLMFYGQGAGGAPTASAVLGDLVAVARNRLTDNRMPSESTYAALPLVAIGEAITRYYIRLDVNDKPGVLAAVASVFADHEVSIATVRQEGCGDDASLVLVTHAAPEAALAATVVSLRRLDAVRNVTCVMRVEGAQS
ncbi:MAG: homoserine dehydrogenase [Mycobacteriales bacterium]